MAELSSFDPNGPLDGYEVFPALQSGQAVQITLNDVVTYTFNQWGGVPQLTQATAAADDNIMLWDNSADEPAGMAFSEFSGKVAQEMTGAGIPEAVTLNGSEFIPFIGEDGNLHRIKFDFLNAAADHRTPRRFKDRNLGPLAVNVLDVFSDSLADYDSGVNASTTTAPTVQVATSRGSSYKVNAPIYGGRVRIEADSSPDSAFGTKVVRLTTGLRVNASPVTADYAIIRRDDIGRVINASGPRKWVRIDMKIDDPLAIDEIQCYIGNGALANFYRWNNLIGDQATRPIQFGTRTRISFPLLAVGTGNSLLGTPGYNNQVTGTPDLASISSFQLRILPKVGTQTNINVYRVAIVDGPAPTMALCMDDGYETWHSIARPVLERYGIRSTIFAIRKYHDITHPEHNPLITGTPGFGHRLSETQIEQMLNAGHELGFHMTGNHAGEDFSPEEVEQEIIAFKKWAKRVFDYDVLTAAYPGGENGYFYGPGVGPGNPAKTQWGVWSQKTDIYGNRINKKPDGTDYASDSEVTVRDVFAKHFPFSRSIVLNFPETDPATDGAMLRCFLYQFGPSYVPSSGPRSGLKSGHPNYSGRVATGQTKKNNELIIDAIVSKGGVAIGSFHDLFIPSGTEVVTINEAPYTNTMTVPANPYTTGGSPLGTQASITDLESVCQYAIANNIACMTLREAFTRSL